MPEGSDKATHLSFNERGTLVFFTEQPDAPPMEQGLYKLNVGSNWKHLCLASEITEEQAKGIVEQYPAYDGKYSNYEMPFFDYLLSTAIESWDSLLRVNGVYWENSVKKPYRENCACYACADNFNKKFREWENAQKKVFDKQRTHIFIKQN